MRSCIAMSPSFKSSICARSGEMDSSSSMESDAPRALAKGLRDGRLSDGGRREQHGAERSHLPRQALGRRSKRELMSRAEKGRWWRRTDLLALALCAVVVAMTKGVRGKVSR